MGLLPAEAQVAAGRILFDGSDVLALIAERPAALRGARMAWCSRIRSRCSTRRCASASRSAKASSTTGASRARRALARAIELLDEVGIAKPRAVAQRLSARAVRRHAPARADRRRAGGRAGTVDPRRAHDRARRHHRGADPRPAGDSCAPARPHHAVHQPQSRRGAAHRRRGRGALCRPGRGAGARPPTCCARRCIPTPRVCWPAIPRLGARARGRLASIPGRLPDLRAPPAGCRFQPRCPFAVDGERLAAGAPSRRTAACPLRCRAGELGDASVAGAAEERTRRARRSAAVGSSGGRGQRPRQDLHAVARPRRARLRRLAAALPAGAHPRGRRRRADGRGGRGGRAGRRVGLGQDDARPPDPAPASSPTAAASASPART